MDRPQYNPHASSISEVVGEDEFIIDVLVANSDEHFEIIRNANLAESTMCMVPVASKRDIIWLRRLRNSDQDRVDISELEENDEDRESS